MENVFEEDIRNCIDVLKKGGLILYPTDTIWGIGCDATNAEAVKRVYELRQRADNKAMIVLVDDASLLERYMHEVPEMAYQLIEVADKPLTIVYDDAKNIATNLLGDNNSVGIRVTSERFSKELCRRFRRPVVSTSANISGKPSALNFLEISQEIKDGVDYIVKYRQDDESEHKASSVIMLGADGSIKILRQ